MKKLIVILILLFAGQGWGATYYVSQNGTGSGCTDPEDPCSITDYTNGSSPFNDVAGDTIYCIGTINAAVDGQPGSSSAQHIFRGDPAGYSACVIDGQDTRDDVYSLKDYTTIMNITLQNGVQQNLITIAQRTSCMIDGVTFQGSGNEGADLNLVNSVIRNCIFRNNTGSGLVLDAGDNLEIYNNQAYLNGTDGEYNHDGFDLSGITNLNVYNNISYSNNSDSGSGIDLCGSTGVASRNRSYNNDHNGFGLCGPSGSDASMTLSHSISFGNGVGVWVYGGDDGDNIYLYNLTIVGSANWPLRIGASTDDADKQTVTMQNCIICALTGASHTLYFMSDKSNYVGNYNDFYGGSTALTRYWDGENNYSYDLTSWKSVTSQDANSIDDDPLFVSTSDFRLKPASPCHNVGTDVGIGYCGAAPEIGRYEMDCGFSVGTGEASVGTGQISNE